MVECRLGTRQPAELPVNPCDAGMPGLSGSWALACLGHSWHLPHWPTCKIDTDLCCLLVLVVGSCSYWAMLLGLHAVEDVHATCCSVMSRHLANCLEGSPTAILGRDASTANLGQTLRRI